MRRYAVYLKKYKKQVILGPFFKLLEAIFELIIPLIMARLIDLGIKTGDTFYVLRMNALMLLLAACGLGCALFCQYSASIAAQGFGTELRNDLFRHIGTLSHRELDRFGAASLSTRITNDVNQLQFGVAMLIRLVIRAPFLCIGGLISCMLIDLHISLVLLVTIPVFVGALAVIMRKTIPLYKKLQHKLDAIGSAARENLSGIRVIRAFARVEKEEARFRETSESHTASAVFVGRLSALSNPLTTLIMNIGILAILWFGGLRVSAGRLTQGEIVAIINYMSQILLALIVVANLVVTFTKASASAARVGEVLDTSPSVTDAPGARPFPAGPAEITFDHVSFSYGEKSENALCDITFTAHPGQTVGVIGLTGSGKSTLVNLVPRFYDVTSGSIRINGVDVRDIPQKELRDQIGFVPQKSVLFSGTVLSNLRFKKQDASLSECKNAAHIAQAAEFIEQKPEGYESKIERGGANLSGGQRQRLSIARALVGRPPILILDDSTSALDFATEARLRRALKAELQNTTVLLVSQRSGAVRHADRIVVLDEGRAVGIGTHEELLHSCERYREIYNAQAEKNEAVQK